MRYVWACLLLACFAAGASADSITFELDHEFSGATPPAGSAPWLTAIFTDAGSDTVTLKLETTSLLAGEKVFEWSFNFVPDTNPSGVLLFSSPTKTGAFSSPTIGLGLDSFGADGDGLFDINIKFDGSGNATQTFGTGDALAYTITGSGTGITAASFNNLSKPNGGSHGPFNSAAHVGGIGENGDDSGWIAPDGGGGPPQSIPLPPAVWMGFGLLAGMGFVRRKRLRREA